LEQLKLIGTQFQSYAKRHEQLSVVGLWTCSRNLWGLFVTYLSIGTVWFRYTWLNLHRTWL